MVNSGVIFLTVVTGTALAVSLAWASTQILPDDTRGLPFQGTAASLEMVKREAGSANVLEVEQGRVYFTQVCVPCHGTRGDGFGEWSYRVIPKPADLRKARTQLRSDQQLFEIISNGVRGTAMIGWKRQLSEAQRRQVIAYVRQLASIASEQTHE